jgi:histidyl-tRNA synthetase
MKIPPVKGTRDFYPREMAVRNWIIDGWKQVSVRNGFEEYDGPIFEFLKMFQIKSGDEIVEQLFSFKDRGDRDLAIRPEITPTLARMVNQRINTLPRPLKWFSVPRLCRAERPQKGRLREFFQWNIDIIGVEDVLADAEVIFTTVDYLRQVGLTNSDVSVKFSSRKLLAGVLKSIGIAQEQLDALYSLLDKKSRLPPDTFTEALAEKVPTAEMAANIAAFMELDAVSAIKSVVEPNDEINKAVDELAELVHYLDRMGVADYCRFDPSIVRGLAYYTGVVFEVHDIVGQLRAIGGGGRYDNLLKDFGGPDISATGMGMGDCVLEILLRGKQLLDDKTVANPLEYFVAFADKAYRERAVEFTAELRLKGISANFSYKMGGLAKQLKEASERNAKKCIIIGAEIENNELVVKDMAAGRQQTVPVDKFFAEIRP